MNILVLFCLVLAQLVLCIIHLKSFLRYVPPTAQEIQKVPLHISTLLSLLEIQNCVITDLLKFPGPGF